MPSKPAISLLLALLVVPAAVLAGCGQSAADKAQSQICAARDDIAKQVDQLKGLTLTSATTTQVTDSLKAIKKDLSTIADQAGALTAQKRKEVEAANQEFVNTVKETSGSVGASASIDEAKTQVSQAFQKLATSYRNTFGKLNCSE